MSNLHNSFLSESEKLENQINDLLDTSEKLTINDIVTVYYQIMNVNSMLQIIKNNPGDLSETLSKTERLIQKKFNKILHPHILSQLNTSIQEYMAKLKENKVKRSQETIQKEANLYEELRELMSTKEFVEQYDKGLIT